MAERELGPSFAIHGGGSDLVFPHHENEIAQSEAAGRGFARIWMHNGMIETDAEKMSKSEGNIFQLSEALDRYGREAVVLYLISGHYRQPLAFSAEQMEQAVAQVERLAELLPGALQGRVGPGLPARGVQGGPCGRLQHAAGPGGGLRAGRRRRIAGRDTRSRRRSCSRCSRCSDSSRWPKPSRARTRRPSACLRSVRRRGRRRTSSGADEIRDRLGELGWEVRDAEGGARLVPKG